jgi:CRISPR/Cas system Type II protein with McrA/HNH and RuvC-like nuclease domain
MGGERNRVEEDENEGSEDGQTQAAIKAQGAEATEAEERNEEGEAEAETRARRIRRGTRQKVRRREARSGYRQYEMIVSDQPQTMMCEFFNVARHSMSCLKSVTSFS